MIASLPTLFVPHGAPTFALRPGAAGAALSRLAASLSLPRAIVVLSPHWDTAVPTVGVARRLETIHDFSGFSPDLQTLHYPASGSPEAAAEVAVALAAAGLAVKTDPVRGLDHGAWVPLRMMFPDALVPVIPLSMQSVGGVAQAWRLGRALEPLARQGFLILASGNITHNLGDYRRAWSDGSGTPAYVRQFADWIADRLQAGDTAALRDYRRRAPDAVRAHPSDEHLLPLFVAYAAAGDDPLHTRFHAGIDDHVLAMDAYAFRPRQEVSLPESGGPDRHRR